MQKNPLSQCLQSPSNMRYGMSKSCCGMSTIECPTLLGCRGCKHAERTCYPPKRTPPFRVRRLPGLPRRNNPTQISWLVGILWPPGSAAARSAPGPVPERGECCGGLNVSQRWKAPPNLGGVDTGLRRIPCIPQAVLTKRIPI